jgi:L-ascorbate metabolism protein UlaG (beta-lactamase superfamily)
MVNKVIAIGISVIIISSLIVGTALLLLSTVNNEQNKYNIIIDDEEIIGERFLYYHGVNISWFGEAAFRIKSGDLIVYIDPYFVSSEEEKADFIICTHQHGEHLSLTDVRKIGDNNTNLYTPEPNPLIDGFGPNPNELFWLDLGNVTFVEPGMMFNHSSVILEFVPAYNINKYNPGTGNLWHPPEVNWTGVIVEIGGTRIYHPGDSEHIPEMEQIDCDIFLAPVGGVAVMTPQEGLKITSNLKYAIPMHYNYPLVSSPNVASVEFAAIANCTVVILKPEYWTLF